MRKFVALDVETANPDVSSICQIGIAVYEERNVKHTINQLINPEGPMHSRNFEKHGIDSAQLIGKPTFSEFYFQLFEMLHNNIVVHHTNADKAALSKAFDKNDLKAPEIYWLDSSTIVKRTWPERKYRGFGLKEVANMLGYQFTHHDALEDAKAAAHIFLEACKMHDMSVDGIIKNIYEKRSRMKGYAQVERGQEITGDVLQPDLESVEDKENYFYGKKVVVSGTYITWPDRRDLANLLKSLGADIDTSISKRTNILCCGVGVGPKKYELMQKNIDDGLDAVILREDELLKLL